MEFVHVVIPSTEIDVPAELYAKIEKLAEEHEMDMGKAWTCLMLGSIFEMSCPEEEEAVC